MVEVTVARLGLDSTTNSYVVVLREKQGTGLLPIWIGHAEARAIAMHMNGDELDRPLTHDLFSVLLSTVGASLVRVNISRVVQATYFAEMLIDGPGGSAELDARPSDAIAIALRCNVPIFVHESLLSSVGDNDDSGDSDDALEAKAHFELQQFSLQKFAANANEEPVLNAEQLKKHLERMRPEDFGKFNP